MPPTTWVLPSTASDCTEACAEGATRTVAAAAANSAAAVRAVRVMSAS
ncbi:Uncharacterised protein [Mycobacteroides abscessus subsp. abscessus]|nr:Uncharacterised protein [Mycobacteroides abscessus subsp. abscessus]